ncbi:MAG: tetratricopeptide repeat protein, partial [Candidatus Hydrogenedentes bacterium]|nr:tetratricopeptide repeat protein [Candidatus Hydrogenedentota bacterium]
FQEALVPLQRANELAPENALVLNNLGHTYLQLEQFPQAETALKRAVAISPRYLGYANLGASLKLQGKYEEAITVYRESMELNPTHYQAWGDVAGAYLWSGNRPEAERYFQKAIELGEQARATNPKDARLLALLANYKVAVGDSQPGLSLARQAQALASEDAEILFIVGEAYELAGLRAESIPRIAGALRRGFPKSILERSPELAALRADPRLLRQIATPTNNQP